MCLIITGQSAKIRATLLNTTGMLSDIYSLNPDGIGVMYATKKGLKVVKMLPKSAADATMFISKLPTDDRELAVHFRWTTHGHTDMDNCHPYDVIPGYVAMMHNGVLHTGNAADKAKSDTWHFIQDYLSESVHLAPELAFTDGFLAMVAEFIGDNRFVFMNGEGKMSIVNKDQGVEHDGMWFSNTYAWKPESLMPSYKSRVVSTRYSKWSYKDTPTPYDDDEYEINPRSPRWGTEPYIAPVTEPMPTVALLRDSLADADVEAVVAFLEAYPITVINIVCKNFTASATRFAKVDAMSFHEARIYEALLMGDTATLIAEVQADEHDVAYTMAEVMCYYIEWRGTGAIYKDSVLHLPVSKVA